ncbi:hypothetical protein [Jiangella mangrovi]|uniref:Uncharacterized protein n=1 Tax=Jiangella mangrovi TaxID=1524084 RepID=A0A7W9GXX2_9ACTN|nr:hypothetical protein [Jiangella mangrovi]MBB5791776.1 hypothetical protein [Jiangella mangrovi]
METWTLVLSAIAAVTATGVFMWGWADRPRLSWAIREFPTALYDGSSRTQISVLEIYAEGSGVAHSVHLKAIGCELHQMDYDPQGPGQDDPFAMQMTSASPPLVIQVWHPDDDSPRALEIRWTNLRPPRAHGFRLDLLTHRAWRWQWRLKSVRVRRWVPIRTDGDWVPFYPRLRHSIPATDPAALVAAPVPTLRKRAGRALRALRGQWDRIRPFGRR